MSNPGYLLVTMEPPSALEEEFNDWYDTEHLPERMAISGFKSALRFVCIEGWPRYMAFYDLETSAALDSAQYRAISAENFSPWSKRILQRVRGLYRASGDQIYSCDTSLGAGARLLLIRFRSVGRDAENGIVDWARSKFEEKASVKQVRVLRFSHGTTADFIALVQSSFAARMVNFDFTGFGAFAATIDLINEYAPYHTGGMPADNQSLSKTR